MRINNIISTLVIAVVAILFSLSALGQPSDTIVKRVEVDFSKLHRSIDGFGANVNPAEWRDGNMKPALDSIVRDLGSSLIRFDCFGYANWVDPKMQQADKSFPDNYLAAVYTSKPFKNAWAAFRYLNDLGIEPVFNVSGAVPPAWTVENPTPKSWTVLPANEHDRLGDFESYAIMVGTMLRWAREKEGLRFHLVMPFNETDLGFPEGPRLLDEDCLPAFEAVVKKLQEYGLGDLDFIIMDDSGAHPGRMEALLKKTKYPSKIKAVGVHTYGGEVAERLAMRQMMDTAGFADRELWLTEYGDLDQTGEIEFEIAQRMNERMITALNNGITAGIVWDAFDNFHKHDTAFALYGLLKTDTLNWTYTPKKRYYGSKQIFKFMFPGFKVTEVQSPNDLGGDIYNVWKYTLRNFPLAAAVSPGENHFTMTGINKTEKTVKLVVAMKNIRGSFSERISYYRTSLNEDCKKVEGASLESNVISAIIPPGTIFTLTNLE